MFSKNIKSITIIVMLLVMILGSVVLYADCEMIAMMAKKGNYISWINSKPNNWDDPFDFFQFMKNESNNSGTYPNNDGYGIIYYNDDKTMYFNKDDYYDELNQAWYLTDKDTLEVWQNHNAWYEDSYPHYQWFDDEPLDIAENIIMTNSTKSTIMLGHDRRGTGGRGNHPFRLEVNGKYYTFEHNGNVGSYKSIFFTSAEYLYNDWFSDNESNWEGVNDYDSLDTWIDSELYFHYIVANIEYGFNGDVIQGIYNALDDVGFIGSDTAANFILSDGTNVYAYKGTNITDYDITYNDCDTFWGITSGTESGTQLDRYDLAIFTPYGYVETIDLTSPYPDYFFSGTVSSTTWDQPRFITDDVFVPAGVILNIDCPVEFFSHCNFIINGTVNLRDDSNFIINHASEVLVENDGILFLDWGSIVKGTLPTTYEATPPGQQVGGEPIIYGDRIIAQNGGMITTSDDYQNPGNQITIESSSGIQWDGIFIQNPADSTNYWFVNCDISGIRKLSIENVGLSARNTAYLRLHQTDFHDAGQIVVRDGHNLIVHGNVAESEYCYFEDTPAYPIVAYESPVDLDYVHIENNGGGIYLYDSSTPFSIINNCNFLNNNGDGVKLNGVAFSDFNDNNIEDNSGFGMICYPGTAFEYQHFNADTLRNNGYAEFVGWQSTFEMSYQYANNKIEDTNYGFGSDQFLLMNLNWDDSTTVNISGTDLTSADLSHLLPSDPDAWSFGGGITIEKEMLYSASSDMGNGNYFIAEQTLQLLISDYSLTNEAGSAVYYLYHLESLTEQDFSSLRYYLENVTPTNDTPLETAIKKIITKTYMKDKEYLIAINQLETVINNSQIPDEVISAMIDEGYCYLKLADESERGLPVNCTVKTATLNEYQAKVRELETQFSFYLDEQEQDIIKIAGNILSISNYPNPFNPTTTIAFDLAAESNVSIAVYNVKGQKVNQLINEQLSVGQHSIEWNGKDSNNKSVASGLYFYKLTSDDDTVMRKMLLLK